MRLFTIRGNRNPLGRLTRRPPRHDQEMRLVHAVPAGQLLGERLVAGQDEPARIAARVVDLEQLEIADHVLIEVREMVELLPEVENTCGRISRTASRMGASSSCTPSARTSSISVFPW
jgi:hypothetical protein